MLARVMSCILALNMLTVSIVSHSIIFATVSRQLLVNTLLLATFCLLQLLSTACLGLQLLNVYVCSDDCLLLCLHDKDLDFLITSPVTGVPPLVSRRALETLTYLARHHPLVAKLLLEFRVHKESPSSDDKRGKAVMLLDEHMEIPEGQASFTLLLSLLNQSLYLRSIAHLEQVSLCKQLFNSSN